MKYQSTIIRQLIDFLPRESFQKIVNKYEGDRYTKSFKCWDQFISIFYAQLRHRTCLREIESGLESQSKKLYHLGIQPIKRSTLSDANKRISYKIYEETFYFLLSKCKHITNQKFKPKLPITSIDSSTIQLCHSLYPWAKYRTQKGGIKLHMSLDHATYLPECVTITEGKASDLTIAKSMSFSPDSIVVFDRAYYSYAWFYRLHKQGITFVSRLKRTATHTFVGQHPKASLSESVLSDIIATIPKKESHEKRHYFDTVRIVTYKDPDTGKVFKFLTNNMTFSSQTIADIYKQRWQIELFFKWIKQRLLIKSFIGTSINAVFSQIWIALILYVLLWYVKHQTRSSFSLTKLSRIFNETAFERIPILDTLGFKRFIPSTFNPHFQLQFSFP